MELGPLSKQCLEENRSNNRVLRDFLDHKIATLKEATSLMNDRFGNGQWQFGDDSYNIRDTAFACKHNCSYCYILPMDTRFGRKPKVLSIEDPFPSDAKRIAKKWKCAENGRIYFFPSSHDIFEENMKDYISVAQKMIDAGHEIMFVSKRSVRATAKFIELCPKGIAGKIQCWTTLTTNDPDLLKYFEPNAPVIKNA
jgi:DNA repair photolyase